jgi:copper resistance protein B
MASQPMTMEHAGGMHHMSGSMQTTAPKSMPSTDGHKATSQGAMMDMSHQPGKTSAEKGAMQNMPGMSGMAMPMHMKQDKAMSKAPPIGSLPTSDGAAPKGYQAYGVTLHMHDDPLLAKLQLDNLESVHSSDGGNSQQWDGRFWVGHNLDKLWIRSEGSRARGRIEEGDVEALWGHAVSPFWNLMLGARHDLGSGLAPYEFDFEATAYIGPAGRTALRVKTSQDWLFTQKLILTPELDMNAYGRADPRRDLGAGVSDASLSFRLRYEFSRKFAPYIGYAWVHKFGATAGMARSAGQPVSDRQILLGVRVWF